MTRTRWRAVNLVLRFVVELAALAALAYWGTQAGRSGPGQVVLAVVTPLVAAWLWGLYAAPASRHRLDGAARLAVEWLVLGGAGLALAGTGAPVPAAAYLVVAIGNAVTLARLTPPPSTHAAGGCSCCSANDELTAGSADSGQLATPR